MSRFEKAIPCLTYNNTQMQDGTGAQLQRILAIYGVATKYQLRYHHNAILRVEFNPGNSENNENELVDDANALFRKVRKCNLMFHEKIFIHNRLTRSEKLRKHYFNCLKILAFVQNKHSHYLISDPYLMIDKSPNLYHDSARKLIQCVDNKTYRKNTLDIKMHIIWAKVSKYKLSNRFTDLDWYKEVWNLILSIFSDEFTLKLTIHTDAPEVSSYEKVKGFLTDETTQYWKEENIIDPNGQLILNGLSTEVLRENFGECKIIRDMKPSEIIKDLANSDIFIMAKSSLSFVAGVVNEDNAKIYSKFWHKTPLDWVEYDSSSSYELIQHLNKVKLTRI